MAEDGHEHVTKTFGTHFLTPYVVAMVFRTRPERYTAPTEERERVTAVLRRWVDRYSERHGVSVHNLLAGPVGGSEERPATTFAVAFQALSVPADWLCFAGLFWDLLTPEPPAFPLAILGGLPGWIEPEPPDGESEEVSVGNVTIGSTPSRRH